MAVSGTNTLWQQNIKSLVTMVIFWQGNIKIWQVDINIWIVGIIIWEVNIIIWQVVVDLCHHTYHNIKLNIKTLLNYFSISFYQNTVGQCPGTRTRIWTKHKDVKTVNLYTHSKTYKYNIWQKISENCYIHVETTVCLLKQSHFTLRFSWILFSISSPVLISSLYLTFALSLWPLCCSVWLLLLFYLLLFLTLFSSLWFFLDVLWPS